ncbi:MAG TPA: hypothetical protein PKB07_13190 [Flavilitoribacter sp.]|nr:hypothetical protein [Flavilitoribacter sp.]
MKKFILSLVILLGLLTWAQAQNSSLIMGMNYQAVARDASGKLLSGKAVFLRVNLLAEGPGGKVVYSERHQVTTGDNGLFNLVIGKGEPMTGTFEEVPWADQNIWLEIAMADSRKAAFTVLGASQLLAVPYAYHAGSAETLHIHENNEKSGCRATGLPFWTTIGNANVNDECHFIGTTINEDLVFKTDNIERLRIKADGTIDMPGNLFIHGNLTVDGDGSFYNLKVQNNLDVGNQSTTKTLVVDSAATVKGQLDARGRVVVDGGAEGSQSDQNSYPLLVKGSTQGIAVEVIPTTLNNLESGRGNNYMSFWKNGAMTGRIEGMNTGDLDPTGVVGLITTLISNPPQGLAYNFGQQALNLIPDVDVDVDASLDPFSVDVDVDVTLPDVNVANPFSSLPQDLLNYIANPTGGPASLIWNTFSPIACDPQTGLFTQVAGPEGATNFKSQIFSNYTLDILNNSVSVFGSIVQLVMSAGSVLDPEDIASNAVGVATDIVNLVITASYADINRGVAYESGSGDYAEWLPRANAEEILNYGDVVGVIGGRISRQFTQADKFMVVSASPIVLGNMPKDGNGEKASEMVAFMGQVPVKVRGVVRVGDFLLPSGQGDGLAIAVSPDQMKARDYQRIIGIAWEASDGAEFFKMVNTAVGINQNNTGKVIEQMQLVINRMQQAIQEVNPNFQAQLFDVNETAQLPKSAGLDYSVAATHPTQMANWFAGKEYADRQEMLQDVKKALVEKANINLDKFPLIAFILDHPEQGPALVNYYSRAKEAVAELAGGR